MEIIELWKINAMVLAHMFKKDLTFRTHPVMVEYGLSDLNGVYIFTLSQGPCTLKSLSDRLNVDKANTTRAIAQMKAKNVVDDNKESDKSRKFEVFLTDIGKEIAQKLIKIYDAAYKEYFRGLSDEDIATMIGIMHRIALNIDPNIAPYLESDEMLCSLKK
ncbi:MAG: hypothetical protein RBR05_03130 [Candidatus Methanomethylophilaceae archaeon]|nr:hypothetical protein [Candidatus Methanomethylophilaceae archaeon]MDD3379165.1 hypothetical protein [Candidatus Methanomethylophilaceae archaeon]MDY0224376.1 hypothetical protein [Candidatus Methanomethylophilaceae archaeon]